jgi:dTDP-4-amino-4,6-dideoxygalactose transaminase
VAIPLTDVRAQYAPLLDELKDRIAEVLDSGRFILGPEVKAFEEEAAGFLGAGDAVGVANGTDALIIVLDALGVGPGDEVICPSFTFVSTANAVLRVGARPVFAEIASDTLGLDPADVARRIGPRTAALLPVHYAGIAPDMDALLELARQHRLRVVEDAAQGLGASFHGRPLGTLGDAGAFSFHETKNVTCGEGGALALGDPALAAKAEIIREKGTNRSAFLRGEVDKYTWVAEGSSYILSDLLAAVLDAQLDRFDAIQSRRAELTALYREGLAGWAAQRGVRLLAEPPGRSSSHHIFALLFARAEDRDRCLGTLRERGVQASFHYVPLHSSPFARAQELSTDELPVTEQVAATLLRLPLHPLLTADDVDWVVQSVRQSLP